MKKRFDKRLFLCAALIFLMAVLLVTACVRSRQSSNSMPIPAYFEGEYAQNGGPWQTLTKETKLNALDGDLVLRGNLDLPIPMVNIYLDHLFCTITVDGETIFDNLPIPNQQENDLCGSTWYRWQNDADESAVIEIHLINPHTSGNPRAYTEFLNNLYSGSGDKFSQFLLHPGNYLKCHTRAEVEHVPAAVYLLNGSAQRVAGFAVLILALLLLGVALADRLQNNLLEKRLWLFGLMAFFAAGYLVLDTIDVAIWNNNINFNTYAAQSSLMLAAFFLSLRVAETLGGKRRTFAFAAAALEAAVPAGMAALYLLGNVTLCRMASFWLIVQAAVFTALTVCCIGTLRTFKQREEQRELLWLLPLFGAILLEVCNARLGWWQRNLLLSAVFLLVFAAYLVRTAIDVPQTYQAARQAEQLQHELTQSRISIMLSQIQPHFLYNSLNSIGYLCEQDPPAAKTAVDNFAAYLRGNLDSLKRTKPVPFEKELEHVRIYLSLEKMRFDEELNLVWNIAATDFLIPALTVQPLVENAVKYGVGKKVGGGTVTISSAEYPDRFAVVISDDGVGYDPTVTQADGRTHIGIDNVGSRLASMVGGSLKIESEQNKGTTATITIPKEGQA